MKHGHTNLMVCPCVQHAVLRVSFKKNYFSVRTRVRHAWTWLGHASNTTQTYVGHGSDTTRTQPNTFFFFQLFDRPKKNSKAQKLKFI